MAIIGLIIMVAVVFLAQQPTDLSVKSFYDPISMIFVSGGLLGALFISLDFKSLLAMGNGFLEILQRRRKYLDEVHEQLNQVLHTWNSGQKNRVLSSREEADPIIETTIDLLISQASSDHISARFNILRAQIESQRRPTIEAWELCGKTAPVFGMIGTVIGLFRMFQGFAADSNINLGSAMALALLTTMYGILIGYGIAAPVATRLQFGLSKEYVLIDVAESACIALQAGRLPDDLFSGQGNATHD